MSVSNNASLIPDRLCKRLAKYDTDIFNRVMRIHFKIARRLDLNINEAMTRNLREHVLKEREASLEITLACAIQVECQTEI